MTSFDVVLVPFPFADLSATKKRPCIILAKLAPKGLAEFLIVCMVTSNLASLPFPFDFKISDLKSAGLPKESIIRLSKIVTIEEKIVDKRLGHLAEADRQSLKKQFAKLFSNLS